MRTRFEIAHYKISEHLYQNGEQLMDFMYEQDAVNQGAFVVSEHAYFDQRTKSCVAPYFYIVIVYFANRPS